MWIAQQVAGCKQVGQAVARLKMKEILQVAGSLNLSKCELICPSTPNPQTLQRISTLFPNQLLTNADGSRLRQRGCFKFLGSAVGDSAFCTSVARSQVHKASALLDKLAQMDDPQVALKLHRHCANVCMDVERQHVRMQRNSSTACHGVVRGLPPCHAPVVRCTNAAEVYAV